MNYTEYKKQFIEEHPELDWETMLFEFCCSLCLSAPSACSRWFKTELGERVLYIEVQDGGRIWKTISYAHADYFTIQVGAISQQTVYYAEPITKEEFTRVLKQAMGRLLRTAK